MHYPIVKVTTPDHLTLFGFLAQAQPYCKTILIHVHGTASSFYVEEFEGYFVEILPERGVSVLFTNNRGNNVIESWQNSGNAYERFQDCVVDINTWIEFALGKGYSKIILQGHSLGTEKVVYYMSHGKYADKVIGVVLLGFSDSFGSQEKFLNSIIEKPMVEAEKMVAEGRGDIIMNFPWKFRYGHLPQTANSYINWFSEGSEVSKALPLRNGRDLELFRNIKVPILGIIYDQDVWTVIPVKEAAQLLESENPNCAVQLLSDTDHCFTGKQQEVVELVWKFIEVNNLM